MVNSFQFTRSTRLGLAHQSRKVAEKILRALRGADRLTIYCKILRNLTRAGTGYYHCAFASLREASGFFQRSHG